MCSRCRSGGGRHPRLSMRFSLATRWRLCLPADTARTMRKELGGLGVRVIRVGTVLEQMRYDVDRIVVQAGKPVEILFENSDMMPHNFVVTRPGLSRRSAFWPRRRPPADAPRRQYVPASDKILLSSRLLQPRESSEAELYRSRAGRRLSLMSAHIPATGGECTGPLYVVDDLEQYLASPESYLAGHPLPIADELLKSTRPRKEWTFDDLASSVAQLERHRPLLWQRQATLPGRHVRVLPPDERDRQRVRPRPDEARPQADSGRPAPQHPRALGQDQREILFLSVRDGERPGRSRA